MMFHCYTYGRKKEPEQTVDDTSKFVPDMLGVSITTVLRVDDGNRAAYIDGITVWWDSVRKGRFEASVHAALSWAVEFLAGTASWDITSKPALKLDNVTIGDMFVVIWITILMLVVLISYLSNVLPSSTSRPQPLLFPVMGVVPLSTSRPPRKPTPALLEQRGKGGFSNPAPALHDQREQDSWKTQGRRVELQWLCDELELTKHVFWWQGVVPLSTSRPPRKPTPVLLEQRGKGGFSNPAPALHDQRDQDRFRNPAPALLDRSSSGG
ncbi:hypothetical protein HPB50_002767 [Hyalomma asiaticum]|uniref:Uncharacterized protein n=1 Tax=Hyalomma asiaticum TaxID=266040 RepID=A0ACB7S9Z7_HYAAI|nr:hypothetical protein HPB50_002767 [Hyalomma asiaticum]